VLLGTSNGALCKNLSYRGVWGYQQLPIFIFETPSISTKLLQLGSWNLVHWSAFEGIMATCKNLSGRGRLGRGADPTFYFGTAQYLRNLWS